MAHGVLIMNQPAPPLPGFPFCSLRQRIELHEFTAPRSIKPAEIAPPLRQAKAIANYQFCEYSGFW